MSGVTALVAPINNFSQEYFKTKSTGEFFNGFKYIVNGGAAGSPWKTNYAVSDNIHFSNIGAQAEAQGLALVYARLFRSYQLTSCNVNSRSVNASSNQILSNPLMIGNDGAGKIPGAAIANNSGVSAVYTKGTANSGIGEKQIITLTVDSAAGFKTGTFYTQNAIGAIIPGHSFRAAMRIKIVSHTNLKQLRVILVASGGTASLATWNGVYSESAQKVYELSSYDFVAVKTQPVVIAANANLQVGIEYGFQGSVAGAAVIEIEQMELIDTDIAV